MNSYEPPSIALAKASCASCLMPHGTVRCLFSREFAGACTRLEVWRAVGIGFHGNGGDSDNRSLLRNNYVVSLDVNPGRFMAYLLHILNIRSRIDLRSAIRTGFAAQFQDARAQS